MNRHLILFFIILLLFSNCKKDSESENNNQSESGMVTPELKKYYDLDGKESFYNATMDSKGNILMVGTNSPSTSVIDQIYVLKIDQQGNKLWHVLLSDTIGLYGNSIIATSQNEYIVVGLATSYAPDRVGTYVYKLAEDGSIIWEKKFYNWVHLNGRGIISCKDDNSYYIAGVRMRRNFKKDTYLLEINSEGDSLFSNTIDFDEDQYVTTLINSNDGGFMLTGNTKNYSRITMFKYNSNGQLEWSKIIEPGEPEQGTYRGQHAYSVTQDSEGNYYVLGTSEEMYSVKTILLKTDKYGNEIWRKYIISTDVNISYGFHIRISENNQLIMTLHEEFNAVIINSDLDGNINYQKYIENLDAKQSMKLSSGKTALFGSGWNNKGGSDFIYCIIH